MAGLIYLASPYTHADPDVQEQRFNAACFETARMLREGRHVFSPIVHGHPLSRHGLPGDYDFWGPYCRAFLERASELVILTLDGWRESVGVTDEVRIAAELGLPVSHEEPTAIPGHILVK